MDNFRESIDALKEAGLADLEILEIMSESVDGQVLTKNSSFIKESGHELPTKNNDAILKTMMLLLKHPQSVKGRQTLSPLKINPKP